MKKRIDQIVVDQGLAPSKTKAQELIAAGAIEFFLEQKWVVKQKSGEQVGAETEARIIDSTLLKYVSRAGLKLEACLRELKINVSGKTALDVGISTGGFSDVLLQSGARHVTGVDVAENELDKNLARNPKLTFLPKINARELTRVKELAKKKFDLIVIDVSFISLEKILPEAYHFLKAKGIILALIKPQFEVGRAELKKNGIVKSQAAIDQAIARLKAQALQLKLNVKAIISSELKGRDGNQEYFLYAVKK